VQQPILGFLDSLASSTDEFVYFDKDLTGQLPMLLAQKEVLELKSKTKSK
jgi:hypothetical protein